MKELNIIHKQTYDSLASEYNQRWKSYLIHQREVMLPFIEQMKRDFNGKIRVLDVGCGVGLNLFILDDNGFNVTGLDLSSEMAKYAKQNVLGANVLTGDFLEYDFYEKYNGVVMDLFIHLFPLDIVTKILLKLKQIIVSGGYAFISTTLHQKGEEGWYEKKDYCGCQKRYRRFYTREDFLKLFEADGVEVVQIYEDMNKVNNKHFINAIIRIN
ncbi:MAG: class I SAM-dependent methyltransferase [Patescibacteria group bacterium]